MSTTNKACKTQEDRLEAAQTASYRATNRLLPLVCTYVCTVLPVHVRIRSCIQYGVLRALARQAVKLI